MCFAMQNIKKPDPKKNDKEKPPTKAAAPAAAAPKEEKKAAPPKDDDVDPPLPPKKAGETFSQQVANNFKVDEGWSVNLDDVEIERQIGQGSFGKVYVGTYFGTKVAIKKIIVKDEREMTLIRREVDMLKCVFSLSYLPRTAPSDIQQGRAPSQYCIFLRHLQARRRTTSGAGVRLLRRTLQAP